MTTPDVDCARVTVTLALLALPAASWPVATMVFSPASSGTTAVKCDVVSVAGTPLTDTATLSPASPLTVACAASITAPFAGASILTVGPCVSMVKVVDAVAAWPRISVAVALNVCGASAETVAPRVNGCESSCAAIVASDGVARTSSITARLKIAPLTSGTPFSRISIAGAPDRRVMAYGTSVALPAASTACRMNEFTPSLRLTPAMEKFFDTSVDAEKALPTIDTVAASLAAPVIVVGPLPTVVPDTGNRLLSEGAVRSMVNVSIFRAGEPAQSVAATAKVCNPSAEIVAPEAYGVPSSVRDIVTFGLASFARTMSDTA